MVGGRQSLVAILPGFLILWLILDRLAAALGSYRGEAGLLVVAAVVAAAVAVEAALHRSRPAEAMAGLGFVPPRDGGLVTAACFAAGMAAVIPAFVLTTGATAGLIHDAPWLALGMFAQGGLAEETVFRGYLFRRLREGRSFWQAALLAAVPFTLVHLTVFATTEPMLAAASLAVALSTAFPLAWLFERSGNSVWPPALAHFAIQAPIKLVVMEPSAFQPLAMVWLALSAIAPWAFFLLRPRAD